ncbi:Ribosomal protein S18 acetylase RimI [Andreprevotia lacus DSM 23236]|jgi:GNAT superfamily N-acetyltransferase|uniref:Ribosomal protein S18 acetylase RimI n=1 Tax=Andreprevotia lacus DSM 23236 TaxID=1121001 RepID=A0A1W1XM25_9NEIS|nr:GNAT family N-acetyltransferase [Andreprevotia lacus]SMC25050.1 Ribosomal protein S18 acetylase RimI [Andreprevotia lacus DSM 23236]
MHDDTTLQIGFYQADRLESTADLLLDMSRHYNGANASSRETVHANLRDNILGADSGVQLVLACSADQVVGLACISLLYPAPKESAQLFMKELYVHSGWRNAGIGAALMRWIAAYAQHKGCSRFDWTVDADNTRALEFYRQLGASHVSDKLYFRFGVDALAALAGQG